MEIDYSKTMIDKVKRFVEQNQMLQPGDFVAAGVSGGADSVCLLLILRELQKDIPFELTVVHVNHKIREEAGEDAAFVEELCSRLGCDFHYAEYDVKQYAAGKNLSEEEAGRELRYQAFREILEAAGVDKEHGKIAVAHNQNDNAETVLFHLFRGTGLAGLSGIRPVRENVIRPLLCVSRGEIEAYLAGRQVSYCIDRTNNEDTYTRNRIRHHILRYAEEHISSCAGEHICDTSVMMREAHEYIRKNAQCAFDRCVQWENHTLRADVSEFLKEEPFLQKEILLLAVEQLTTHRKDISACHIQAFHNLFLQEGNRGTDLPGGLQAYREYGQVVLAGRRSEPDGQLYVELQPPDTVELPDGAVLKSRIFPADVVENKKDIPQKAYTKWFDYDKIIESLVLRTRRTGDYLIINRQGNRKTLKEYLIEEKIPKSLRDRLPVLADGNHVLWVAGHRISEHYKVDQQTKTVLEIQMTGGTYDG